MLYAEGGGGAGAAAECCMGREVEGRVQQLNAVCGGRWRGGCSS